MTNDLRLIHTQGLDEGIRCAMCTNTMKSDKGCDGGCVVDQKMYEKVLKVIHKALDAQPMRDATEEERKSVKDYIESISKPTGVRFDAQLTDAKETIIKSALKGLVKMQIEEGSVGFAVDNDPDHDCCWDDVLAWLEAQPCRDCICRESVIEWFKDKDIIKTKNQEENARRELAELPSVTPSYNSIKTELKSCEDCISRQEGIEGLTELINNFKGVQGDLGAAVNSARELIKTLPSVKPTNEDIKEAYIKGYDYGVKDWFKSKTQPCDDCISRANVLSLFDYGKLDEDMVYSADVINAVRELPSVKPKYTDEEIDRAQAVEQAYVDKMVELAVEEAKRPKGKWIKCKSRFGVEYFKCSECGRRLDWIDRDDNYCNNCGSDNSESTKEWFKDRDTKLAEITEAEKND